jgi:hypothetical protein
MSDLLTHAAIIGRTQLMPGILPVNVDSPGVQCLVAHAFPASIKNEYHNIDLDISDCTLFTVTHVGLGDINLSDATMAEELLEQALTAISEVIIWNKAMDQVGTVTAFTRQVGRLDVKFFFIDRSNNRLIAWRNPLFWSDRQSAALMAGILNNMIVNNGPAASPVAAIIKRVMSSLDLVNLGFYTESFVNLFSLVDDLTQEVIKAGMAKKGLSSTDQKDLLRAIKEERLKLYLTQLAKLCDWKSLEDENPEVFKRLMKANSLRNDVMHSSTRLQRQQALESGNDLLVAINWLRVNPFGYVIPPFPLLKVAEAQFMLLEPKDQAVKDKQPEKEDESKRTERI